MEMPGLKGLVPIAATLNVELVSANRVGVQYCE
jgi:hypothetical protein